MLVQQYIEHISKVKRYSQRTCAIYQDCLDGFYAYMKQSCPDASETECLDVQMVRRYEVHLMDERRLQARTVNLHLTVLSGFCRYLIKNGILQSNPVRLVTRPKEQKRLPVFYREDSMDSYMEETSASASEENLELLVGKDDKLSDELFLRRQRRLIISLLYQTGLRRSELIGLNVSSVDFSRKVIRVCGKGNKMREIPVLSSLCEEISLYLDAASSLIDDVYDPQQALLRTLKGARLYPVYVDRAVKRELEGVRGISGRRSPHVLRHTLATELLDNGADLNSIKELLGHSSLSATQVYTHNSIEKLQKVYNNAHPRAKNGGNNGD